MDKQVLAIPCPDFLLTSRCNLRCKYCFEHNHKNEDMDGDMLNEYLSHNPLITAFPFGGEPLLVIDKLINAIKIIEDNDNIPQKRKDQTLEKFKCIITNGILIPQLIDKLKKHNFNVQISVDGCKDSNDMNRVFPTGKSSFDHVIKAIECCVENEVEWSLHGVFNRDSLPHLFESTKWYFDTYTKYSPEGIQRAIDRLGFNTFQIIFEDDYTDGDVDILIDQFSKIAEWIWNEDRLTKEKKEILFDNFFFKHGAKCGAGVALLAIDTKFDIYPCHRLPFRDDAEDYKLGNVFKPKEFKNYKMYNSYFKLGVRYSYMYSAFTQNSDWKNINDLKWFMWCPSTNITETGSPFFQPVKYNIMFTELNRLIKGLRLSYFGSTQRKIKVTNQERC